MRRVLSILGMSLLLAIPATAARAADRWIHIAVDDGAERVRVNLPLALVEEVLPLVEGSHLKGGRVTVVHGDLDGTDVRKIWQAVRRAPEGDFVTVDGTEGNVRVANRGGFVTVHVDKPAAEGAEGERVRIKLPVTAVDALFAGDGDQLDLAGLLRSLGESPAGDLVTVEEGAAKRVRIWVDVAAASK